MSLGSFHRILSVVRSNTKEMVKFPRDRASCGCQLVLLHPQNEKKKTKALRVGATHLGLPDRHTLEAHSAPGLTFGATAKQSPAWRPLPTLSLPHHSFHFDIMKVQLAHCLKIAYDNWRHVSELAALQRVLEL